MIVVTVALSDTLMMMVNGALKTTNGVVLRIPVRLQVMNVLPFQNSHVVPMVSFQFTMITAVAGVLKIIAGVSLHHKFIKKINK